jgi:hypothetical protein
MNNSSIINIFINNNTGVTYGSIIRKCDTGVTYGSIIRKCDTGVTYGSIIR